MWCAVIVALAVLGGTLLLLGPGFALGDTWALGGGFLLALGAGALVCEFRGWKKALMAMALTLAMLAGVFLVLHGNLNILAHLIPH